MGVLPATLTPVSIVNVTAYSSHGTAHSPEQPHTGMHVPKCCQILVRFLSFGFLSFAVAAFMLWPR